MVVKYAIIPDPSMKFLMVGFDFLDSLHFTLLIRRVYIVELVLYIIWKQKKQYAIVLGTKTKPVFCEQYISSFPNSSATSTKPKWISSLRITFEMMEMSSYGKRLQDMS